MSELKKAPPLIVAHRGFSKRSPENTLRAISDAVEFGADVVEIDVQFTRDRKVIIMHDNTVNRTTNGTGPVSRMTLAELKQLDAGSWKGQEFENEQVPTLEEALKLIKDARDSGQDTKLLIELKFKILTNSGIVVPYKDLEVEVVRIVQKHDAQSFVIIQSFVEKYLRNIQEIDSSIPVSILVFPWSHLYMKIKPDKYSYNLNYYMLSNKVVTNAHRKQTKVFVWTVDKDESILTCIALGVDGIITNNPVRAKELVETTSSTVLRKYKSKTSALWILSLMVLLIALAIILGIVLGSR